MDDVWVVIVSFCLGVFAFYMGVVTNHYVKSYPDKNYTEWQACLDAEGCMLGPTEYRLLREYNDESR